MRTSFLAQLVALTLTTPLAAQSPDPAEPQAQNAIVVTAQRSGAPMWTIDTDSGAVILVGEIRRVPKGDAVAAGSP